MKYTVLKEHDSHFLIHDGESQFKVAKKGLSDPLLNKIRQYPKHYDEGGAVTADDSPPDDATFIDTGDRTPASDPTIFGFGGPGHGPGMVESLANQFDLSKSQPVGVRQTPPVQQPEFKVAPDGTIDPQQFLKQAQPTQATTPEATQTRALPKNMDPMAALKGYQGAAMADAKAKGQAFDKQAKIMDNYVTDMQVRQAADQEQLQNIARENANLFDSIQNEKVDPKRLWNDASTGNKIAASIGLILGGMGAGLTHGPNQALQVIQNTIDRDIDAQKANIGKQQNLLTYNLQKYRDMGMAQAATRLQMNTIANAQVQKAALESGSPEAQAQAQMLIHQSTLQYGIPLMQQMRTLQAHANSIGGGVQANGPDDQYLMQMDAKYAPRRVLVNGKAFQHTGTDQDAAEMRTYESKLQPIMDEVHELDSLGPTALFPTSENYQKAQALRANLSTDIAGLKSTAIGSKRINETEAAKALEGLSDPTRLSQLMNGGLRNQVFFKNLQNQSESMRQQNLIGYKGMNSVPFVRAPQGQTLPLNGRR